MKPKYTGSETEKARANFPFSVSLVPLELIYTIAEIKKAAVLANIHTGKLDQVRGEAIGKAADEIIVGKHDGEFYLPYLQGGAGTSINSNVNEVIAFRAQELILADGKQLNVHPNDHVNLSQSTNDVNPSALRIVCIRLTQKIEVSCQSLIGTLKKLANKYKAVPKLGRTHLQDAVPTTAGAEFSAYAKIVERNLEKIKEVIPFLYQLNLGGTAIGNSINAPKSYLNHLYKILPRVVNMPVKKGENLMALTSSQSDFLSLSQSVTTLMMDFSKMASDIRFMASGPQGGIGELTLPELQKGSTIMPGKVNPIIPEAVNQAFFVISGNNLAIEQAAHGAEMELGIMFPTISAKLIDSLKLAAEVIKVFDEKCLQGLVVNEKRCRELLEKSSAYATLLTPVLGYDKVSNIVKDAISSGKSIREYVLSNKLMSADDFESALHLEIK